MSAPTNSRVPSLGFCNLLLLLVMVVFFIIGTTLIVLPQNTSRMFPKYSQRNPDKFKTLFPERNKLKTTFPERNGRSIKVLYWTYLWGQQDWGFQSQIEDSCPSLADVCQFTVDRAQYNDSDVVLFHITRGYPFPKYRPRFQKWVFSTMESPINGYRDVSKERWAYNVTMTYKRTSDVSLPYGECRRKHPKPTTAPVRVNYAVGKKHLVAWFVSHCTTQSRREVYARELAKHIDVHKFGCGGNYTCPVTNQTYCDRVVLNGTYKFYLSFENSLCREYITEKVYRILKLNVVPVVLGYANYTTFLPPNSFIDVRDFESPKDLANYLIMLSNNDDMYNKYFAWKETYTCMKRKEARPCKLCRYVQRQRQRKQVADVLTFWKINKNCVFPKRFYHGMISL